MLQIHLSKGSRVTWYSFEDGNLPNPRPMSPHLYISVLLKGQVEDPPGIVVQSLQQVIQTEAALAHGCQQ